MNCKYPWHTWLSQRRLVLRRKILGLSGTRENGDYSCSQSSMVGQVRNALSRHGLTGSIEDLGTGLVVTIHRNGKPKRSKK